MSFNKDRAEALRSAIRDTVASLKCFISGDVHDLLTEHLALLQEAELIYLTDAFVGEGEETAENQGFFRGPRGVCADDPQAGHFKITADGSTAVALDYFWRDDMSQCPSAKVQLLGGGGVAVYGQYNGDPFWVAWAPCPKRLPQAGAQDAG